MLTDLPTRTLLDGTDVDRLTETVHLLLAEVAVLTERVTALEAGAPDPAGSQQRVHELTARVLDPFLA